MGLRFRKSLNLGGGFRVNISKHGVGYSWGVKGARITTTSRGTSRTTLSIPGTGVSYVKEKSLKKKKSVSRTEATSTVPSNNGPLYNLETVDSSTFTSAEYKEFLDALNKVRYVSALGIILLISSLFLFSHNHLFLGSLAVIAGIGIYLYAHTQMPIPLEYEYDEQTEERYKSLRESWLKIAKSKSVKQLKAETHVDARANAGVTRSIDKLKNCRILKRAPYFIKPNIEVFGIKLSKFKLIFLPDKLLIVSFARVGALNYDDIDAKIGLAHIVTEGKKPSDSKIVGSTWLKVNKDGSPDKRFKNNRQLVICEYGAIVLDSPKKLHIEIVFSNASFSEDIKNSMEEYFIK